MAVTMAFEIGNVMFCYG